MLPQPLPHMLSGGTGCWGMMTKLGPLSSSVTWAELRGVLDKLITHLSCCVSAAGVGGAAMPLCAAMLVDVEEVVVAAVVGALGAVGANDEVFVDVTAVVLLDWSLELILFEPVPIHVFGGCPIVDF